ncbi:MAG: chemotaxis protein CheD [Nanoarchaeota archaeon]
MAEELMADMGRYVIGRCPDVLVALGLGSCIGCVLYDPQKKIGGMAHVMLPTREGCARNCSGEALNKFADVAIRAMYDELIKKGCKKERISARVAGGAHMFGAMSDEDFMNIGKRNYDMVCKELKALGIPIVLDKTGGATGRTIRFNTESGKITVKTKDGINEYG